MRDNKKIFRFLWISFAGLLALCIATFALIINSVQQKHTAALHELTVSYMEGLSLQIQRHFETLVEMRMIQVKAIVHAIPPEDVEEFNAEFKAAMSNMVAFRDFSHLSLYDTEGNSALIYGPAIEVENQELFLDTVNKGDTMVTLGQTADGTLMVIYGISVGYPYTEGYPMIGDAQCTALIAGVPVENLYKTLSLGLDESLIFSHIVRKDGTFVVKNYSSGVDTDTIYEWYRKNCRESGIENADERINEMEQNILNGTPYNLETAVNGEQRHVYTSPLPHTD